MKKEEFYKADKMYKEIAKMDEFIRNYKNTRGQGFLKIIKGKIIVGHKGYGSLGSEEMECGEELSKKILELLEENRNKLCEEVEKL